MKGKEEGSRRDVGCATWQSWNCVAPLPGMLFRSSLEEKLLK